jgi:hypothetical protein
MSEGCNKERNTVNLARLLMFALVFGAMPAGNLFAQDPSGFPPKSGGQSVSIPAESIKLEDRGNRGVTGKIDLLDMYGNGKTGQHGTFMRFTPGFFSHVHTHTYDYYGVVITGVVENYNPGKPQTKMGPGSYWYQKGLEPHITACVSKEPCLTWVVQSQKFDVQDLDKAK